MRSAVDLRFPRCINHMMYCQIGRPLLFMAQLDGAKQAQHKTTVSGASQAYDVHHLCHPAMRKLPQHMQGVSAHRCRRSMSLHLQGASLHALWQLESALLKRFEVPSFQALQLPSGCSSLLSVLAAQDELAAALTGYADAWDCGAVSYESVLRVVQQALASMRHGTRGRSRSATTGE